MITVHLVAVGSKAAQTLLIICGWDSQQLQCFCTCHTFHTLQDIAMYPYIYYIYPLLNRMKHNEGCAAVILTLRLCLDFKVHIYTHTVFFSLSVKNQTSRSLPLMLQRQILPPPSPHLPTTLLAASSSSSNSKVPHPPFPPPGGLLPWKLIGRITLSLPHITTLSLPGENRAIQDTKPKEIFVWNNQCRSCISF